MKRRNFIKNSTMGIGVVSSLSLDKMSLSAFQPAHFGEDENDNILVIIQLFGGNDGMNTITPYEWDYYYNTFRPTLHVPQNVVKPISKSAGMAMHPNLAKGVNEGMYGLFKSGKLGVLSGLGYPNPDFSHFRSTDIWLSGIVPSSSSEPMTTGWLGRYFDAYATEKRPEHPFCIQIGSSPSLTFLGETGTKSIVLEDVEDMYNQGQLVEGNKIELGSDENEYYRSEFDFVNNVGVEVYEYSKVIKKTFDKGKNIENYSNVALSQKLKLVARLIDGGLKTKVYFVEHEGYDTHANQGVLDGTHAMLLGELSEAISSFQSDIEKLGHNKRVIGITASEFGRRPQENGSAGTDHGSSSIMFSFGTEVRGEIIGEYFGFYPLFDGFNHSYVTDFRSIYFEIMTEWFGKSVDFAATVLGRKFNYINETGFLKKTQKNPELPPLPEVPPVIIDQNTGQPIIQEPPSLELNRFSVYPNPITEGWGILKMELFYGSEIEVIQTTVDGREVARLHSGKYGTGTQRAVIIPKGGPGIYILRIRAGKVSYGVKLIKL